MPCRNHSWTLSTGETFYKVVCCSAFKYTCMHRHNVSITSCFMIIQSKQRHVSGCSSLRHQQTAIRIECDSSSRVLVAEVRFRDATSTTAALAEGGAADRVQARCSCLPLSSWSCTTIPCQRHPRVADLGMWRHLCSASTHALVVPPLRLSTVGDRAFPVAAALVTASTSLAMFMRHLKIVLFAKSY